MKKKYGYYYLDLDKIVAITERPMGPGYVELDVYFSGGLRIIMPKTNNIVEDWMALNSEQTIRWVGTCSSFWRPPDCGAERSKTEQGK